MATTSKETPDKVITVASKEQIDTILAETTQKHVMVDFYATWCEPCMVIGPYVEKMANEYEESLVVLKIDVDNNSDLADEYEIKYLPTFLIIKNRVTLDRIESSLEKTLLKAVKKICGKPEDRPTHSKHEKKHEKKHETKHEAKHETKKTEKK